MTSARLQLWSVLPKVTPTEKKPQRIQCGSYPDPWITSQTLSYWATWDPNVIEKDSSSSYGGFIPRLRRLSALKKIFFRFFTNNWRTVLYISITLLLPCFQMNAPFPRFIWNNETCQTTACRWERISTNHSYEWYYFCSPIFPDLRSIWK